jgi:hypothetical protein
LSSAYSGFLADVWWDLENKQFLGAGVAYWDPSDETTNKFGRHAARLAAGIAYGEAIDPSSEFVSKTANKIKSSGLRLTDRDLDAFYSEKRVAEFLKYGAAVWVERYFIDRTVPRDADPHWARKWSMQNIERRGGLDSISKILSFNLSVKSPEASARSAKLISEAGLVVAFIMDGECQPVSEAHTAWKEAFVSGNDLEAPTKALTDALIAHEAELRQFAKS